MKNYYSDEPVDKVGGSVHSSENMDKSTKNMENNNEKDTGEGSLSKEFLGDVTQITYIRPEVHPTSRHKIEASQQAPQPDSSSKSSEPVKNNDTKEEVRKERNEKTKNRDMENENSEDKSEAPTISVPRDRIKEILKDEGNVKKEVKEDFDGEEKEKEKKRQIKISCHKCGQKLDVTHLDPFSYFDCPACGARLIVPKWFDNYLLEEPGGVGGMATVYRALDIALDREVAIKVLNPELGKEKQNRELFLHEARTAATINHYAVVPIYTCGEFDGQPYMVMQYMYGGSLEDKLKTQVGFLPLRSILQWIHDVAEGLDNARRHGIIHHDIKPGNIMLDADANAKIGDFGIAQALNDQKSETIYELTKGWLSPHYVSPEKVRNGREDFLGDIYSLGATFYHLITGVPPFDYDDTEKVIKIRLTEDPIPVSKFRPDVPKEIEKLIASMMHRDPDKRPNYIDIVKTLKSFLNKKKSSPKKSSGGSSAHKIVTKTGTGMAKARSTALANKKKINAVFDKKIKRTNPALKLTIHLISWVLIIAFWYFAWTNGYLDGLKARLTGHSATQEILKDWLPEATQAFKDLNLKKVKTISKKVLNDPENSIGARKQAGLYLCLASYLNNENNAQDICRSVAERLLPSLDNTEPYMAIILFLNNISIQPFALSELLQSEEYLYVVGKLAILLRAVYLGEDENRQIKAYKAFHTAASQTPANLWVNAWAQRRKVWIWAIEKHIGDPSQLEPLFRKLIRIRARINISRPPQTGTHGQSTSNSKISPSILSKLTPRWLSSHRLYAYKRPKPEGFSFTDEIINNYLISSDEKYIKIERARIKYVKQVKSHICKLMLRIPYENQILKLKNGTILRGTVIANPNFLSIKLTSGKRKRIQWKQISPDQMIDILRYYAEIREKAIVGGQISQEEQASEVATDYFLIALFADWYGRYGKAAEAAKKALRVYPPIAARIKKYLLTR